MGMDERMMMFPSVSTVTFFRCETFPNKVLEERLSAVLSLNPWLAATLKTGSTGKHILLVPPDPKASQLLSVLKEDLGIRPSMQYADLVKICAALECKTGNDCLDKEEQLLRLTVFQSGPGMHALVYSMNHVLGDGHTYYKIYEMLG